MTNFATDTIQNDQGSKLAEKPRAVYETKMRILDAAESLFSERGFAETSLRVITHRAQVNLAAVNYHFGSKKSLIQAVFQRCLGQIKQHLHEELDKLEATCKGLEREPSVEEILKTFIGPVLTLEERAPQGAAILMKLVARAYAESQGHLRRFLKEHYGDVLRRYSDLLNRVLPEIEPFEQFWRHHFMVGAAVFTLSGNIALGEVARSDFDRPVDVEGVLKRLIPFVSAGLQA